MNAFALLLLLPLVRAIAVAKKVEEPITTGGSTGSLLSAVWPVAGALTCAEFPPLPLLPESGGACSWTRLESDD